MTLLIIRHGETALNVARVLQPADTPLSARGHAQAAALGRRLAAAAPGQRPVAIVSSDLPRALQTAQAIAEACGLPVLTSPLLHERNFGDLRGQPYDSLGHDPLTSPDAPPGGESLAAFGERCRQAWAWLLAQPEIDTDRPLAGPDQPVGPLAVVTHGLVIREWLERGTLQLPTGQVLERGLANTSLTIASRRPPHTVRLLDCTTHLDSGVGEDAHSLSGG